MSESVWIALHLVALPVNLHYGLKHHRLWAMFAAGISFAALGYKALGAQ